MKPHSISELRELLELRGDGRLVWKKRPMRFFKTPRDAKKWNARFPGKPALANKNSNGYLCGRLDGRNYKAHRVVYALHRGRWPENQIDHIDGNRTNNRPDNLRDVTNAENCTNRRLQGRLIGVCWHKNSNKWQAQITKDGQRHSLGIFADYDEAVAVRRLAERGLGFLSALDAAE